MFTSTHTHAAERRCTPTVDRSFLGIWEEAVSKGKVIAGYRVKAEVSQREPSLPSLWMDDGVGGMDGDGLREGRRFLFR